MLLPSPLRRPLGSAVPALVAAVVFAFAAGSSSVAGVKSAGLDARWLVLAALALAVLLSVRSLRSAPRVAAAAAVALVVLALVSAAWSVDARESVGHALSLALLFATALLLAAAIAERPEARDRVLLGLLAGAAVVALAGAVLLAVAYGTAVVPASIEAPARYRGFGENPNTAALLLALASPLALHFCLRPGPARRRVAAAALLALFLASIVGSGSHGALLAAAAGLLVSALVALPSARGRLAATAASAALAVGGLALQGAPRVLETAAAPPAASAPAAPSPRYVDVEQAYPLDADVGRPLPGGGEPEISRSLFASSGRTTAWRGALGQAAERPLLGYGFGTEARVFDDRYYTFVGGLPESSYIGMLLQLGALGLAVLLGLVAALALSGRRALAARAPGAAACAGVLAAGLVLAVVQSYVYSVGNIGTTTFWIAAFLLPTFAATGERA